MKFNDFGVFFGPMSWVRDHLAELAANLHWTWFPGFEELFREVDVDLWSRVNHNPTAFLGQVAEAKLESCSKNESYRDRLEGASTWLRLLLQSDVHWASWSASGLQARPVAYFSAEFGLHESLPIYSGGLGILAGDHLKSASDLGIPMYGISILYRQGYFRQLITAEGRQQEEYAELDMTGLALERVVDEKGNAAQVTVEVNSGKIILQIWRMRVGRAHLLLLDVVESSETADASVLTRRLYEGDLSKRLTQELILGVGGLRALQQLGVRPGVLHLNEGHSAFAVLEAVARVMEEEGRSFEEASETIRASTVFTTHTPVEAGHDRFASDLIERWCGPLRQRLGLSHDQFMGLGRVNPTDAGEPFCMTVLALRFSNRANAVSTLHGATSRKMWKSLWPGRSLDQVPIGHVTNGVHVPSWLAPQMKALFERHLGTNWHLNLCRPELWRRVREIDPAEIWRVKRELKLDMLGFLERRLKERDARLGRSENIALNPEALTIGFVRRFVEYKRAPLLFRDPDRLAKLLSDVKRPIQIVFAGKAHPHDERGKEILHEIWTWTQDSRFRGRVFLIENHDMNVSRHLVRGCDLWLNTPRRPFEACGTSGQKAMFNGTLNLSTLDGWWAEAFDQENGFAFGEGLTHRESAIQDRRDLEDFFRVFETQVVPEYFDRNPAGLPLRWVTRMQHALSTLAWRYNSDRMVIDYARRCYLLTAGALTAEMP